MIQIRYWIEENRKVIFVILGVFLTVCLMVLAYHFRDYFLLKEEQKKVEKFPIEIKEEVSEPLQEKEAEKISKIFTVDIKGAVEKPGVYEVEEGKRVQDVINLASGLKDNADVSLINLSKKVEDEMVIIVYTKEEILAKKKEDNPKSTPSFECPSTPIINDACIGEENLPDSNSNDTSKVSINQANLEILMTLPGIGESKAQSIISYREKNGGFQTLEDLMNVSGIGEAVFAKIEPYIML